MIPKITLEDAEKLSMETDYAVFASEDVSKINTADAGAFFLEGYNHARRMESRAKQPHVADYCSCEMPAKIKGKNECYRCRKPFKETQP